MGKYLLGLILIAGLGIGIFIMGVSAGVTNEGGRFCGVNDESKAASEQTGIDRDDLCLVDDELFVSTDEACVFGDDARQYTEDEWDLDEGQACMVDGVPFVMERSAR